ncbi:MAG: dihydroorotase [Legionellaceae bacterium]|nr:dihydroorotase [Legionellaceae bacterium]HCA89658.1 dihydroorotase [Legionellales bacterium]|tara:strand:- start:1270 stop:2307 length:1038 start_codon:yes stop_codon:yes gene_type:complete
MQIITINQPDDWHVHLRDGLFLKQTVDASACYFARALVMPNLNPALTSLVDLIAYRTRILAACTKNSKFNPLMTFYLNHTVKPDDLIASGTYPFIVGAKLYPAGVTTNSAQGATSVHALYPLLDLMQTQGLVLQVHGEVLEGDVFAREAQFIKEYLSDIVKQFPRLKIVLEHISTQEAVEFVEHATDNVAATITPHHLLYNRNHLLAHGLKPHYYCLPILKHARHQQALHQIIKTGHPRFFAGTDSAPHTQQQKESACGCAGIYSAPYALSLYAHVFETLNILPKLNDFMSVFGAQFYGFAPNSTKIELVKKPFEVPMYLPFGEEKVIPIAAGQTLDWSVMYAPS